jgi:hypothetical protein
MSHPVVRSLKHYIVGALFVTKMAAADVWSIGIDHVGVAIRASASAGAQCDAASRAAGATSSSASNAT